MKNTDKLMKSLFAELAARQRKEWPPGCFLALYQSKRPVEQPQADKKQSGGR